MDGWIKLHRQIVNSSKFADPDILRLWIYCLTKASHKSGVAIIEKQEVPLEPGQFVTGRFSLEEEYNKQLTPRKKIKDTTLWSWLKRLETWGDLDIKSYNKYSVVTVLKWCSYQETLTTEPQQTDNRLTTEPQQTDTNKNVKNKELKHIVDSDECDLQFEEFWKAYPKRDGKTPALKKWTSYYKAKQLNFEEVMDGLNRYIAFVTHERTVRKFDRPWLSGSTFVNQRQWESEWKIEITIIPLKPVTREIEISPESEEVLARAYGRASST